MTVHETPDDTDDAEPANEDGFDDDVGPITQTSGFHLPDEDGRETHDLTRGDFEIGIQNGEGYLKLPIFPDGEVFQFSIPKAEVEAYAARRDQKTPAPKAPSGFEDKRDSPDGWTGGNAVHTGGGIWARIWQQKLENGRLEVIYGVPECSGVDAGVYSPDGDYLGTIEVKSLDEADQSDATAADVAYTLMSKVNNGKYDDEISERLGTTPN